MPKVKICGIRNLEDALGAVEAGADAVGFVFYEPSPRYICADDAKKIIEKLPPFVTAVGLFVNESADVINSTCRACGITLAQIHFEADDEFYNALEVAHVKVVRAKKREDLLKYKDEYRLVDAYVDEYGGVGIRLEVEWFRDIDCGKIILAGGLRAEYLDELREFNFFGFDVSSGVEKAKGVKDIELIRAFVKEAKV